MFDVVRKFHQIVPYYSFNRSRKHLSRLINSIESSLDKHPSNVPIDYHSIEQQVFPNYVIETASNLEI